MTHVITTRNVSTGLRELARLVIAQGAEVPSRNGLTKELTHVHVELERPLEREISVAGRGHNYAAQIAESMWILAGRNDVEFLAHYLPRSPQFSDDGKVWRAGYGPRLRAFGTQRPGAVPGVDQLKFVVDLLNEDPGTRRAVMTIWDPAVDSAPGKDIPCNNWLHFLKRGDTLDLHVAIRSNDLMWGWSGINAFEWSVLLEVVAALTKSEVGHLHFSISSLHLYEQHWDKARRLGAAAVGFFTPGPRLRVKTLAELDLEIKRWFASESQIRAGHTLTAVGPDDPLLRSWLGVLVDYWAEKRPRDTFVDKVTALHDQKHAAYGDSWMKRGEAFSIIPNIARKVDRLESGGDTDDETQADTAIDLLVYLAKYRCWLTAEAGAPSPYGRGLNTLGAESWTGSTQPANALIAAVKPSPEPEVDDIVSLFEELIEEVRILTPDRHVVVDDMLPLAAGLARKYSA